jgi:hypothetical protein
VAGSRLAAVPRAAVLCGGLGLTLAGCGASSPAASAPATVTVTASAPPATASVPPASAPPASAATSAGASGNPACPSAGAVSAAARTAYLPPTADSAAAVLNCSYRANSGLLLISFEKARFPLNELQRVVKNQALAQGGVQMSPVHGIGDAAFLLTIKGTGPATRELIVRSGSRDITILGAGHVGQLKAIARVAIAS